MAKAAIFCPNLTMCETVKRLLPDYPKIEPMCIEQSVAGYPIIERAQELAGLGCDLFVARGLQATQIRGFVDQPLVDIHVAAQELGMIILETKEQLNIKRPRIGVVCSPNMLCSTSNFDELFGIELHLYPASTSEQQTRSADRAMDDGMDALIGGTLVCDRAKKRNRPCTYLMSGEESLRETFDAVDRLCRAIDLEKKRSLEYAALLDSACSGVMQVDADGQILMASRHMEALLGRNTPLTGHSALTLIPGLTKQDLDQAVSSVNGSRTLCITFDKTPYALTLSSSITGENPDPRVILTFQEGHRIREIDRNLRQEMIRRDFLAVHTFEHIPVKSEEMSIVIEQAKFDSQFTAPVLIEGPAGCERNILAQSIHNAGVLADGPFIPVDCQAWPPEKTDVMLFGSSSIENPEPCLAAFAQDGTLFLNNVEYLLPETQYKVMQLTRGRLFLNNTNQAASCRTRVIASTSCDLLAHVEQGTFRSDLYYTLNVLNLSLSPLSQRREDILPWAEWFLNRWQEKYGRQTHLTVGASVALMEYEWPGNLFQLDHICERMVLLSPKPAVSEAFVRNLLEQAYPSAVQENERIILYKDKKAQKISELLGQYNGNREKVAAEMGISKTTLWRYMKKYGIGADYSF